MQIYMLKENVEAKCERKVQRVHQKHLTLNASKICAGKIKDPSGVKRKDFRGSKAEGGLMEATARLKRQGLGMGGSVCKIAKRGQNRDAIGKNS